ncbi:MAG: alanyl-tRNA editing protein [Acidobacteriota bacterium]|nr:alanyl-tRNA editing protein [Acidobacteriota bacterium]
MDATAKLYLNDSFRLEFEAGLQAVSTFDGKPSLVLDQSAFYGESGGQLGDRGTLTVGHVDLKIVDSQYGDGDVLHHLFEGEVPENLTSGAPVIGKVDFERRRDMMSQHTGQHMLSAALYKELGAETVSSRLGSRISTIDTDKKLTLEQVRRVAALVNDLIMEDLPIRPLYPDEEALAAMQLSRLPKVTKDIRILEIEGFDRTPCGGTHCSRTGQVGPVYVTTLEKCKSGTRVNFLCGKRVLDFLAARDETLALLGETLGCGAAGVAEAVTAMRKESKELSYNLGAVRAELNGYLSTQLHQAHPPMEPWTPVVVIRDKDDLKSLRALASALAGREDVVALVAGRDAKSGDWRVIVERGERADFDAGGWFRGPGAALGGRGGGRPNRAEGRFPADLDPTRLSLD